MPQQWNLFTLRLWTKGMFPLTPSYNCDFSFALFTLWRTWSRFGNRKRQFHLSTVHGGSHIGKTGFFFVICVLLLLIFVRLVWMYTINVLVVWMRCGWFLCCGLFLCWKLWLSSVLIVIWDLLSLLKLGRISHFVSSFWVCGHRFNWLCLSREGRCGTAHAQAINSMPWFQMCGLKCRWMWCEEASCGPPIGSDVLGCVFKGAT